MAVVEKQERGDGIEQFGEAEGARRATGGSPSAAPVVGETEVVAKAQRRRFTAEYKRRIVREADRCTQPGALGALLRREGLYSSHLITWRRQRERGELAGLSGKRRGRKAKAVNPLAKRVAELEHDKRRLERKLERAELLLDIQKKASRLLEIPLRSPDDDDGSA